MNAEGVRADALGTLLARTEEARGIRSDGRVAVRVVHARDLEPIVVRAMRAEWTEADLRLYQDSLVTMGLWPSDLDLAERMAGTIGTEAVGLYIPEERALYVVRDPAIPWRLRVLSALARRDLAREYALAHELVHYLQHTAYPDLFAEILGLKHSDDTAWAGQTAIEGDAVRYGFAALGSSVPVPSAVDFQTELEKASAHGTFAEQPILLRESIVFPYIFGYRLSTLEATLLLEQPPASTEQALHLERRYEPFTVFDVPDVDPEGCERTWSNSLGELGISMLLRDASPGVARQAWEGWDGDRYRTFRCSEAPEFVWLTTWDSDDDATQFAEAYVRAAPALAARARLAAAPTVEVGGRDVTIATPRLAAFARGTAVTAQRRRVRSLAEVVSREIKADPTRRGGDR